MSPERSSSFLQLIRRTERGRLKIYLGYAAGVGKTSHMLQEGHRLRHEGVDVVAAWVESHGRAHVESLAKGLEILPPLSVKYHGVSTEDLDLEGLLKRRPQVALIDELAHSNAPGSRHAKRFQDVQEIRAAGIHVISTLNVQHLESLYDTVERMTAVKVRERLPDLVLKDSDEVVNVDLAVTDLIRRLQDGQIMPIENVEQALAHFYRPDSLEQLRELALRELASSIDFKRREESGEPGISEQFLVALGPDTGSHPALLRYASRMAGRLSRNWYAVHVRTEGMDAAPTDPDEKRRMAETMELANQLGAVVFTVKGQDVVEALLDFAHRYRVSNLIVGKGRKRAWNFGIWGRRIVDRLLGTRGFSVQVVDVSDAPPPPALRVKGQASGEGDLGILLKASQVLILRQAVRHRDLILSLAIVALEGSSVNPAEATDAVMERERRGSTFLNSGLALPHASLKGLDAPRLALALPRAGLTDFTAAGPMEAVFLLLTPAGAEASHLELLSAIGRAFQNAALRSALRTANGPEEVLSALDKTPQFALTDRIHVPI